MLGVLTGAYRNWPRLGLGLLLAFAFAGAHAAQRSLRFEHIGMEQGLAQETVSNILQDRKGFMWFGTQAGLSRYDGYRIKVFKNDPSDPRSLVDGYVTASFEDADGTLWFGTKGGLTRYDPKNENFIRYDGADSQAALGANRTVSAIASDGRGGLWIGTSVGLRHVDPKTGRFSALRHDAANPASLCDDRVNALALERDGTLWVGTSNGLDRLDAGAGGFVHFAPGAPNSASNHIHSLSLGPGRTLWIGTANGLQAWGAGAAPDRRRVFGAADGIGAMRVLSLYHDQRGNLWAGTDNAGLKWMAPGAKTFASYRHEPMDRYSLRDNQVVAVSVDRSGTLWVGGWFGGVSRADLASGGFTRITNSADDPATISSSKTRAVVGAGPGQLWIGTMGMGLNLFDVASGKAQRTLHDPDRPGSLPDNFITALAAGADRLWVGSPSGLSWRDPAGGRFTRVPLGVETNANYIQRLMLDRAGMLWVLTRGGLHRVDPKGGPLKSWRHDARVRDSLGDDFGFALGETRDGALWIGTENGLDRFDRASGRFTHFRHDPADPTSLRHGRVHDLFESKKGEFWVGTAGGLHKAVFGADGALRFRFYPINLGRAAEPVGATLEDERGRLWVSTTSGMTRLDPLSGQFKNYTSKDGLVDGSYFIGAGFAAPDGQLHYGGVNGMTSFRPAQIQENPTAPQVVITDFLVFNQSLRQAAPGAPGPLQEPIQDARRVALTYRDSVLSLEFAALHFADPQRNRYSYQLVGFDQGWVDTDAGKRFATYTNLDPGRYLFRVKASNKDGVWSETPAELEITITPPLWKTWWFRLLTVALVAGTAYFGLRARVRALMQQQSQLEQQVSARTAELVLQKESVERQKETVELAHRNIAKLSEIGRKITAKLDSESIMLMLYDHVNELMEASVFGIGVYRPEREMIDYPFAMEGGKRYAPYSRSMREPNQLAVWCIANEREVFINDLEAEFGNYIADLTLTSGPDSLGTLDDGTLPIAPRSMLYVPISVNGRMLGVVTVHSYRRHAYERIHLDMLRTLAAYVGVAFDNAGAYRQLKDTQEQLMVQEKLAALGSLVAGVAHELNTPIGNSLLMASTLQQKTSYIAEKFDEANLRKSDLANFIGEAKEASSLIMRSLLSAADLVNSFKQVAVDQASAHRRRFNLEQAVGEITATMMNQVRKDGHKLELDIPGEIMMDSFPGPLGQVIINFINNAALHAFDDRPGGTMRLSATLPAPRMVRLVFRDDGAGIPPDHLARIFDPFFTTKLGFGGSGLGLNITYNIVTQLLGGQIRVESVLGKGTAFILDLPLVVPAADPAI
ncbi:MAG: two-component regulator propeller domain-containing protein [Pseudomonadota bacterium]